MYSKASLMALCAAAAVKEVAAGHGHQQVHANKRELVWAATETVIITDYVTVTVTEGQEPTAISVPATAATTTTTRDHRPPHHSHSKHQSSASATSAVTSTPVVVVDPTSVDLPTVVPTTMVTAVKPTSSVVESSPAITTPTTTAVPVPTVATTTTASPKPTQVSSGGKRGLAYNDASLVQEFITLGGEASWAYNWGLYSGNIPEGVTYYPMLWSPAPDHSNGWDSAAKAAIAKGTDALLGFNEPDIASQANMSPQDAAAGHIKLMNPYAGQARLSAPAISSSQNANQGIDWLKQFFSACNGQCKFDFCSAHWYGPGGVDGANLFLSHLKDVSKACDGKPVWVTEFAAESGSVDEFMSTIVKSLESDEFSFVEKYSYFMASVGDLFASPTELTSYGKIYAGVA
ncbi:glycosyl hydrolase catalytic core-domain-containing protein [Xylaria palmicola]|nr:glycosyl hydrolase catalytic core-domain-containing protein [Xylaria palmicola]